MKKETIVLLIEEIQVQEPENRIRKELEISLTINDKKVYEKRIDRSLELLPKLRNSNDILDIEKIWNDLYEFILPISWGKNIYKNTGLKESGSCSNPTNDSINDASNPVKC